MERDRTMTRTELQRYAFEMPERINGAVDIKMHPYNMEFAKAKLYLEQLDEDRPAGGVTLVESFRQLDSNIAELKVTLNAFSQQTEGKIAAAQGAATSMPEHEVVTLNSMFRELMAPKAWSDTAATKAEVGHHDRRLNFMDVQISGTNEKLNALTTHLDEVQSARGVAGDPTTESAPPGGMNATGGATGRTPCSGSGVEHATLIKLLTVRVQTLEAARVNAAAGAASPGEYRQPFMPHLRRDAPEFEPAAVNIGLDPRQPLQPRQIGMLTGDRYGERPLYDDKSA